MLELWEINTKALGRGAPEMFLYPSEFSYWQPADSIAIFKLLALKMSGQIDAEVTYAKASLVIEDKQLLSALLPDSPGKIITKIPYLEEVSSKNFSDTNNKSKPNNFI